MTNPRVGPIRRLTPSALPLPLLAALVGVFFVAPAAVRGQAGNVWTITCVQPTSAGSIDIIVRFNQNPQTGQRVTTTLTGTETAAQKASKIAAQINNAPVAISATANGAAITVQGAPGSNLTDVWVGLDSTGEANDIGLVPADPFSRISIVEFPTQNPGSVPSAGQLASMTYTDPNQIITGTSTSDGAKTAGTMVSALNASTGLTWTPHTDPASGRSYFQSNFVDPTSADIQWNAFTSSSIANFGLDVPEPGSVSLILLMTCALTSTRRRARLVRRAA
jgi:hypothetical protein